MMTLKKFYDLIDRDAEIVLKDVEGCRIYFGTGAKNTPDKYYDCEVIDFEMNDRGRLTFKLLQGEEARCSRLEGRHDKAAGWKLSLLGKAVQRRIAAWHRRRQGLQADNQAGRRDRGQLRPRLGRRAGR